MSQLTFKKAPSAGGAYYVYSGMYQAGYIFRQQGAYYLNPWIDHTWPIDELRQALSFIDSLERQRDG